MAGVQEENRRRIALSFLVLGLALILLGIGFWVSQQQAIRAGQALPAGPRQGQIRVDNATKAKVIQHVLFMLLVLVGILSVSLYAFKLWSRRFKAALFRKPKPPTPSADVWAMHRVPTELMPDDGDGDADGGGAE